MDFNGYAGSIRVESSVIALAPFSDPLGNGFFGKARMPAVSIKKAWQ